MIQTISTESGIIFSFGPPYYNNPSTGYIRIKDDQIQKLVVDKFLDNKLRIDLDEFLQLEFNWDGKGAKAPSKNAIRDANMFLDKRPSSIPLPLPEEEKNGGVGLYWESSDSQIFAEVTFDGDGTFSYLAIGGTPIDAKEEYGGNKLNVVNPWPPELIQILNKIPSL